MEIWSRLIHGFAGGEVEINEAKGVVGDEPEWVFGDCLLGAVPEFGSAFLDAVVHHGERGEELRGDDGLDSCGHSGTVTDWQDGSRMGNTVCP